MTPCEDLEALGGHDALVARLGLGDAYRLWDLARLWYLATGDKRIRWAAEYTAHRARVINDWDDL